jgi:hypothetical protein
LPNSAFAVFRPAPQRGFVDHVVVQERGRVDEFDDRGELVARAPRFAERASGQQHERRAQALAAGGDDVLRDRADEGDVRIEASPDDFVDLPQVLGDGGADRFQADRGQRVTLRQVFDLTGEFAYYSEFGFLIITSE